MNLIKIWAGYQPLITFFTSLSIFVLILFGSDMVLEEKISIGEFSTLMVYLTMLSWPVIAMGLAVDWLKRGNASLSRVDMVMNQEEEADEAHLNSVEFINRIEFNNVNFSYDKDPTLKDLSFSINRGDSIGITGKTASGKSTLLNLILKFNKAKNIFLNDVQIDYINKDSIRSKIFYVPQEPIVFSGTIKDNISFFDKNPNKGKIEESMKVSNFFKDFEKMPDGLETIVGERGLSLSGGQRQRLSIARAIYQEPEVLMIDDTLSSLDIDTELKIISNLKKYYKDKILIVVSSRVSTIFSFDKILVLDKGQLVESGDSSNLIKNKGLFDNLLKIQKTLPEEGLLRDE